MKSKLSIAISAALAAGALSAAGGAQATAVVADQSHFFPTSGSTAMNNPINEYFLLAGGICQGSTTDATQIDVYTDGTFSATAPGTFGGFHQMLFVCKPSIALGSVPTTDKVAIAKEGNGGSLEGTISVAEQVPLTFLDPLNTAGITCTNAAGSGAGSQNVSGVNQFNTHENAFTVHTGCTTTKTYVPVIGWADELPQTWLGFGNRPIAASDIAALSTTPLVQNVFGIAVSENLYRALQNMQGKTLKDDTLAAMPSLNASTVAGLYTGTISDWSAIKNAAGTSLVSFNPTSIGTHAPNAGTVFLCRRGDSSGTNAFVDLNFIGNRCNANGISQQVPSTSFPPSGTQHCNGLPTGLQPVDFGCSWNKANNLADAVFAGAGGGDVAACLDAHNANNDWAVGNLTTNQGFKDPNGIGGSTGDTAAGSNVHFRFVAIEGHLPNLTSVANGQYPYVEDNVLNALKTPAGPNAAGVTALYGAISTGTRGFNNANILLDVDGLQTSAKNTSGTADTDWNQGLLFDALNTPGTIPTPPVTTAAVTGAGGNPTSVFTQAFSGNMNNCQPPLPAGGAINP
jgi:hypothetical protein